MYVNVTNIKISTFNYLGDVCAESFSLFVGTFGDINHTGRAAGSNTDSIKQCRDTAGSHQ